MKTIPSVSGRLLLVTLLITLLPHVVAHAQLGDLLRQGNNRGNNLGNLGGLGAVSGQTLASGSIGNVAGLLEFCVRNNYLGSSAASVKDSLMGKIGSRNVLKADSSYTQGGMGILKSGDGHQLDLSGGGFKAQATRQVCDAILAQAKSFL